MTNAYYATLGSAGRSAMAHLRAPVPAGSFIQI